MKITDKITKILRKAKDPAATEDEAVALMAMAERLMREHGVTEVELDEDPIKTQMVDLGYADPWRRHIVFAAARYYFCEALNTETTYMKRTGRRGIRRAFLIIGREGPRTVAHEMIHYLDKTVVRLAREYSSERQRQLRYARGCGDGLADRLTFLRLQREDDLIDNKTTGTDLILREQALVEAKAEELASGKIITRGSEIGSLDSEVGRQDAYDIPLNEQVKGDDTSKRRQLSR